MDNASYVVHTAAQYGECFICRKYGYKEYFQVEHLKCLWYHFYLHREDFESSYK